MHGADYTVNDVCERCNNVILSELDSYFCELYDRFFVTPRGFGATVVLEYDYRRFARALLKIAYNSARTGPTDPTPLAALTGFILGSEDAAKQLAVLGELVSPTLVPDAQNSTGQREVMPVLYRSVVSQLTGPGGDQIHTRVIAVNSFYFHLIVPKAPMTDEAFRAAVKSFAESIQGIVELQPDASSVTLKTSPQDGISSIVPHLQANADKYQAFFDKRRNQ